MTTFAPRISPHLVEAIVRLDDTRVPIAEVNRRVGREAERLGATTILLESRLPFSVEPKLPVEVTASDRIDLPVTVANDTDVQRAVRLQVQGRNLTLLRGRAAQVFGDPDQPHTYTYLPDIGEGLATLGEHPDAPGEVWHLPNDPHTRTTRQLVDMIYQHAGHPHGKLRAMPALVLRVLGLANPTVRELVEMQYQFAEPFIVDSSKMTDTLGVEATPVEQALADTLRGYRNG